MLAVIDTSVWVAAALNRSGPPGQILAALERGQFSLVTSVPLVDELADVLSRPRLVRRYGLARDRAEEVLRILREGRLVDVHGTVRVCRDPNDDMVIETAINGGADVLVSRDDDLKGAPEVAAVLAEHGVRVLTVQRFLDALGEEAAAST